MPSDTPPLFSEFTELPRERSYVATVPPSVDEEETECTCPTCNCEFEHDEGYEIDGQIHCSDCVYSCENCSTITTDEDEIQSACTRENATGYRSAESCLCSACRFTCDDCLRNFANSITSYENASGNRICGDCAESYYACDECSCTLHSDDTHSDSNGDGTYCSGCVPSDDGSLHQHSYKPSPRYLTAPNERTTFPEMYMGIELEVDHEDAREREVDISDAGLDDCNSFYCKEDGSLDNGFEIVSHPGTWAYWQSQPWNFTKSLKSAGYRSYDTTTCGMHVHVSKKAVSKLSRYKLLQFFRTNAKFIEKLSRRRAGVLARWAAIDGNGTACLIKKVKDGPEGRYEAINLLPSQTVEFRIFRGTLEPKSIRRNIALVYSLCRFVQWAGMRQLWAKDYIKWLGSPSGIAVMGKADAKELVLWCKDRGGEFTEG